MITIQFNNDNWLVRNCQYVGASFSYFTNLKIGFWLPARQLVMTVSEYFYLVFFIYVIKTKAQQAIHILFLRYVAKELSRVAKQ